MQMQDSGGTKRIRFLTSNDGSAVGQASVNWTPSTGVWYHIALVYTAATPQIELFVDGVSQGTAGGTLHTSLYSSTAVFWLGQDNSSGYFNGRMVSWRVWNTTRTGTQLGDNKCITLGATSNLQAEWTLDDVYTDNSGNSNTLTPTNTPTFSTDIPTVCSTITISVSDQLNVTESVTMTLVQNISVSDQLNITESVSLVLVNDINVSDQITITESVTVETGPFSISVSDQLTITDAPTVSRFQETENVSVSDQLNVSESMQPEVNSTISVNDQVTVSESVSQTLSIDINVSDQLNLTESVTIGITINLSVYDQLDITESVTKTVSEIAKGLVYMRGNDQNLPVTLTKQDYPLGFNDTSVS